MDYLIEEAILTATYNKCKNGKELCDYQCGQKFARDMFLEQKMNVCKANCDVIWDGNYVKQLTGLLQQNINQFSQENIQDIKRRLDTARQRLKMSKQRLFKTKMTLKKVLYSRRQDMSMNMPKQGPAFEG